MYFFFLVYVKVLSIQKLFLVYPITIIFKNFPIAAAFFVVLFPYYFIYVQIRVEATLSCYTNTTDCFMFFCCFFDSLNTKEHIRKYKTKQCFYKYCFFILHKIDNQRKTRENKLA